MRIALAAAALTICALSFVAMPGGSAEAQRAQPFICPNGIVTINGSCPNVPAPTTQCPAGQAWAGNGATNYLCMSANGPTTGQTIVLPTCERGARRTQVTRENGIRFWECTHPNDR